MQNQYVLAIISHEDMFFCINNAEHRLDIYTGIDAPCKSNLPHSEPQARLTVRCAPTNGKIAESCNGHESESFSE